MAKIIDFPQSIIAEKALVRMTQDINTLITTPLAVLTAARLQDDKGKTYSAFEIIRELAQHLFALGGEVDREMQNNTPPGGNAA